METALEDLRACLADYMEMVPYSNKPFDIYSGHPLDVYKRGKRDAYASAVRILERAL